MNSKLLVGYICFQILIMNFSRVNGGSRKAVPITESSNIKSYHFYSHVTGKFVQMRGKKVDANGRCGDEHAKIEVCSLGFNGQIMIRSFLSQRYLCFNKKGRLITKARPRRPSCRYYQVVSSRFFDTFQNVQFSNWFIGFNEKGKPRPGSKTKRGQTGIELLKRPLKCRHQVTTSSPTYLRPEQWEKIHNRFHNEIHNRKSDEIMQSDEPSSDLETRSDDDPFGVKKELDKRRRIAMGRPIAEKDNQSFNFNSSSNNSKTKSQFIATQAPLLARVTPIDSSTKKPDRKQKNRFRTNGRRRKHERNLKKRRNRARRRKDDT